MNACQGASFRPRSGYASANSCFRCASFFAPCERCSYGVQMFAGRLPRSLAIAIPAPIASPCSQPRVALLASPRLATAIPIRTHSARRRFATAFCLCVSVSRICCRLQLCDERGNTRWYRLRLRARDNSMQICLGSGRIARSAAPSALRYCLTPNSLILPRPTTATRLPRERRLPLFRTVQLADLRDEMSPVLMSRLMAPLLAASISLAPAPSLLRCVIYRQSRSQQPCATLCSS